MLKALMLKRQIDLKKAELKSLTDKKAELEKREAELESAISEVKTEEEQRAVEEEIGNYEAEKAANEEAEKKLTDEIRELEGQLEAEEAEQDTEAETAQPEAHEEVRTEIKKGEFTMEKRFEDMNLQERDAFCKRDDVKTFLGQVRTAMAEKRAITGAGALVPDVMLGLVRRSIEEYSKLYKHFNVRRINGQGRMVIEGQIPEAVWTEACANLNELDLTFGAVEVDEFKCGGFFRVCNATLADSDIALAEELLRVLGQAIGYALDKASVYGTGTKMPEGIVTTLAGVEGTPNIFSIAATVTGLDLFGQILTDFAAAGHVNSNGEKVWIMNEQTYTKLVVAAMSVNAAGAIVSGLDKTMPIIGGTVETLPFVPDNVIIAGYGDMYLLAERQDITVSTSEHAFWVADQTGFKGVARYDGKLLDDDAFVAIGINGVTPTAAMTFAPDTANA